MRSLLFLLLVLSRVALAGPDAGAGKSPMDLAALRSPDDAFWKTPSRGRDRLATELVGRYRGLVVDAPRCVALDRRATFPIGVVQVGSIRELSQVSFERNGVLAVMNVTTNRLLAVSGGALDREERVAAPPRPPGPVPEGDMSTTKAVELRELLHLPWTPARYVVSALINGEASNRVAVQLCATAKTCTPKEPATDQRLTLTTRVAGGKRVLEGTFQVAPTEPGTSPAVWLLATTPTGELENVLEVATTGKAEGVLVQGTFATDVDAVLRGASADAHVVYAFSGEAFVGPLSVPAAPAR